MWRRRIFSGRDLARDSGVRPGLLVGGAATGDDRGGPASMARMVSLGQSCGTRRPRVSALGMVVAASSSSEGSAWLDVLDLGSYI